ncbi:hypothetical protein SCHIN_v1c03580 [Spiroplasma chinense]|uniref:Glycoside hydrolase 123 catalytic domain-containing protein n=1 Tax=Spiroplasma chinense TaxID=216932 RepID=A0A5B9Y430_9MOLU|nr:glycoside hydrolase domain-containing protein [Spiroplasma chinense]QEH61555.1 hypothetical protein SCHIN_v1c03580 [Spiroplasma chinense]
MKKLLRLLGLSAVALSIPTVSCSRIASGIGGNINNGGSDDYDMSEFTNPQKNYNYQSGAVNSTPDNKQNNNPIYGFFGSQYFTYAIYNKKNGTKELNGDKQNYLKVNNPKLELNVWKEQSSAAQLILVNKFDNLSKYTNLKVSVDGDQSNLTVEPKFEKFIDVYAPQANNNYLGNNGLDQYVPDATYQENEIVPKNEVQPVWINFKADRAAKTGTRNLALKIDYVYDGKEYSYSYDMAITIDSKVLSLEEKNSSNDLIADNQSFDATPYFVKGMAEFNNYKQVKTNSYSDAENNTGKAIFSEYSGKTLSMDVNSNDFKLNNDYLIKLFKDSLSGDAKNSSDNYKFELIEDGEYTSFFIKITNKSNEQDFAYINQSYKIVGNKFSVDYKPYNSTWKEGQDPTNKYIQQYLAEPNSKVMDGYLEPLKQANQSFLYVSGFHKNAIEYYGQLKKETLIDKNSYYKYLLNNSFEETFANGWDWKFNFTGLLEHMKLAAKYNIKEIHLNTMDVGGFSFNFATGDDTYRELGLYSGVDLVSTSTGKISSQGNVYVKTVHTQLAKQLSKFLIDNKDNKDIQLKNGDNVKIYSTFDEQNESSIETIMKNFKENAVSDDQINRVYSYAFIGWRSEITKLIKKNISANDEKKINDYISSDYVDTYVMQSRMLKEVLDNNFNMEVIRKAILNRRESNKVHKFYFYNSWNNYPGAFIQSDYSETAWLMLFSALMGANGFVRFAYDHYATVNQGSFDENGLPQIYSTEKLIGSGNVDHEAGQDFLTYGGDANNNALISIRMQVNINILNHIYKLKTLLNSGLNVVSENTLIRALSQVGYPVSRLIEKNNNQYKWYESENNDIEKFNLYSSTSNNFSKTLGQQVYELISIIDKLKGE